MSFAGSDPDQLRTFARELAWAAEQLDHLRASIGQAVESSTWDGHDADQFRSDWYGTWSRVMISAAGTLSHGASAVRGEADQQELASSDGGAGSVAGGGTWSGSSLGAPVGRAASTDIGGLADALALAGLPLAGAGLMGNGVMESLRRVGYTTDGVLNAFGGDTRTLAALAKSPVVDWGGKAFGAVGAGLSGLQAYQAFDSGNTGQGLYHTVQGIGGAAKTVGGPWGYVLGSTAGWYADIVNDSGVDWTPDPDQWRYLNPFVDNQWKTVWVDGLAEAYTPSNVGHKLAETTMSFVKNFL